MIVPEEGYINYLIICLFIVFQSNARFRIQTISLILVTLFFTKGSLCFFIYSISFYFLFVEKKKITNCFYNLMLLNLGILWLFKNK